MTREYIGQKLKAKREAMGLDKTAFAKLSGLTRMQIRYIEDGKRDWTAGSFIKYCDAVGVKSIVLG